MIFIFIASLIFFSTNFLISYIATIVIPYQPSYSYPDLLYRWNLPYFYERFAGFDGLHYIKIALEGYQNNATAFLPVYPISIRAMVFLTGLSPITSGIIISAISFLLALIFFRKYLKLFGFEENKIRWSIFFLLIFPTSFFFQSVYTESVFLMFVILTLYYAKRDRTWLAALFGFMAGLSRITGFFLVIPIFLEIIAKENQDNFSKKILIDTIRSLDLKRVLLLFSPALGFSVFLGYLWITTGDPLRLAHSQVDFGQNRSTSIILFPQVIYRYLKIFITAAPNHQYFIAVVEFCTFIGALWILILDGLNIYRKKYSHRLTRAGLNLFATLSIFLPSSTGTFLSMARFILPLLVVFIFLAEIKNKWTRYLIATVFLVLHITLLMFFIQGYFVS